MPDSSDSSQFTDRICPYCGKSIKGEGVYCQRCLSQGFHHVYELTGRTNGWDRPKPHYRVVGRKAS